VGCRDDSEEQLGAGVVHRGEADLVDQDEVGLQDLLDHPSDAVVGETAIEDLDKLGGGEIAHPLAGVDGVMAEGDEEMRLAGPRRSYQTQILFGSDPLER